MKKCDRCKKEVELVSSSVGGDLCEDCIIKVNEEQEHITDLLDDQERRCADCGKDLQEYKIRNKRRFIFWKKEIAVCAPDCESNVIL